MSKKKSNKSTHVCAAAVSVVGLAATIIGCVFGGIDLAVYGAILFGVGMVFTTLEGIQIIMSKKR